MPSQRCHGLPAVIAKEEMNIDLVNEHAPGEEVQAAARSVITFQHHLRRGLFCRSSFLQYEVVYRMQSPM